MITASPMEALSIDDEIEGRSIGEWNLEARSECVSWIGALLRDVGIPFASFPTLAGWSEEAHEIGRIRLASACSKGFEA